MLKACWFFICEHCLMLLLIRDLDGHFAFILWFTRRLRREEAELQTSRAAREDSGNVLVTCSEKPLER